MADQYFSSKMFVFLIQHKQNSKREDLVRTPALFFFTALKAPL